MLQSIQKELWRDYDTRDLIGYLCKRLPGQGRRDSLRTTEIDKLRESALRMQLSHVTSPTDELRSRTSRLSHSGNLILDLTVPASASLSSRLLGTSRAFVKLSDTI